MLQWRPSDQLLTDLWGLHYGFRPSPHLLLVEDEGHIARAIAHRLERCGYEVLSCGCAHEARELIEQIGLPHGAIIDLTLPDMAGEALCKWINAFSDIPLIALLPADVLEDSSRSSYAYADGCVGKPLDLQQLVERVRCLMRCLGDSCLPVAPLVQVDNVLAVDFVHQCALLQGRALPLSPLETKIMHILMRRAGRLVTTEFLASRLERVADVDGTAQETVHTTIKMLQQKLEITAPGARYIQAVTPSGYMFVTPEER